MELFCRYCGEDEKISEIVDITSEFTEPIVIECLVCDKVSTFYPEDEDEWKFEE